MLCQTGYLLVAYLCIEFLRKRPATNWFRFFRCQQIDEGGPEISFMDSWNASPRNQAIRHAKMMMLANSTTQPPQNQQIILNTIRTNETWTTEPLHSDSLVSYKFIFNNAKQQQ